MFELKGEKVRLRALEPSDLEFLYQLENDTGIWEISGTLKPYSRKVLKKYLENAHRDIYEVKQLRLGICRNDGGLVGLIDLFDFDPRHRRAGVGMVIARARDRNQGLGSEALSLLCDYAFKVLDMHQLYANILAENRESIHLFEKLGFEKIGRKKQWIRSHTGFKDELMYQKINTGVS